ALRPRIVRARSCSAFRLWNVREAEVLEAGCGILQIHRWLDRAVEGVACGWCPRERRVDDALAVACAVLFAGDRTQVASQRGAAIPDHVAALKFVCAVNLARGRSRAVRQNAGYGRASDSRELRDDRFAVTHNWRSPSEIR